MRPYAPHEKEDSPKRSSDWEGSNSASSEGDEFYFEEAKGGRRSGEETLSQLLAVMNRGGYKMPVRVEIDETGYLKEQKTGMYILDECDNGFELSKEDLSLLQTQGVISL
jgi:hypothetical protein